MPNDFSEQELAVLRNLAVRTIQGNKDVAPLTDLDGNNISHKGTFWVEFRDANASERDEIVRSYMQDKISSSPGEDGSTREMTFNHLRLMETLIKHGLIRDACLPYLNEKSEISSFQWPKRPPEQRGLLHAVEGQKGLSYPLMMCVTTMALEFYGTEGAVPVVVEEGKDSPSNLASTKKAKATEEL